MADGCSLGQKFVDQGEKEMFIVPAVVALPKDRQELLRRKSVEQKWGKYPYRKTTYEDGSVGFEHLTPDSYDREMHEAYEAASNDEQADLKRLGELMEQNMLDWWD
ncbi:MAG: hypothetical protein FWC27_15880 [Firmicutes bacterium]|nr:hypothetical protein [Bacillota bacterium]